MATAPLTRDLKILAGVFVTSGVVHLVRPETFEPIMPKFVPAHREVICASGVVELACAAGLLHPRTRQARRLGSLARAAGRLPGQLQDGGRRRSQTDNTGSRPRPIGRLPLQLPVIRSALRAART